MKKAKPKVELILSDTEPWIYQYLRDSQISLHQRLKGIDKAARKKSKKKIKAK